MANLRNRNHNNNDGSYNDPNYIPPEELVEPGRATSYRDGYVHGRVLERRRQDEVLEVRDNNNAARGLLIGLSLASLVGLGLAALFFWNQRPEEAPTQIIVPQSVSPSPSPQSATQNRTTVIERQVEQVPQVIPVPQQPATAPQQSAPKININVPRQPAPPAPKTDVRVIPVPSTTQQAPAPKQETTINVTPPQSSTQKSTTSTTTNSTSSNPKANPINPSEGTQNQTDTQSGTDSTP